MEKNYLEIFIEFLKKLPLWLRLLFLAAIALAVAFVVQSCANTKAVVRASAESTQASVTITTNNPTTVHVTNKQDTVGLNFNPRK
jgi:ABC-type enterochelin transport system substrate-binding protein